MTPTDYWSHEIAAMGIKSAQRLYKHHRREAYLAIHQGNERLRRIVLDTMVMLAGRWASRSGRTFIRARHAGGGETFFSGSFVD